MKWVNTEEQESIIKWQGERLVIKAFAGTGKTTTLLNFAEMNPQEKILYIAYNRAIRDEAEKKFPYNVECKTSHQLAWGNFGRHFKNRLTSNLRITDIAKAINSRHWPLACLSLSALNSFLCSADKEPGIIHLPSEEDRQGIAADKLLSCVQVLWYLMTDLNGSFPITHDLYLKLYQLSEPDLSKKWSIILFDEAQDANPVTSALVLSQKSKIILVGDSYQQIYRFRGAVNALDDPLLTSADHYWLTNSFRFGGEVARVANVLLEMIGETKRVNGFGDKDLLLSELPDDLSHYTILSRTVSGVIGSALAASLEDKNIFWVGGIEGYKTEELEDLYWFSADMPERIRSPRLTKDYRDFDDYCSIAKATKDIEMNQAIRLLEQFFPLPLKLEILRQHTVTNEKKAQVTVSTVHRSKGLEWPVVQLNEDFCDIRDPLLSSAARYDETCLLYVAVTRARATLVINEMVADILEEYSSETPVLDLKVDE